MAGKSGPERLFGELVTHPYFRTLGVEPALGRFFLPSESSSPGTAPAAVLSYGAWQSRFGGARDVIGRTLELNTLAFTVVGVAPRGFLGVNAIIAARDYLVIVPGNFGRFLVGSGDFKLLPLPFPFPSYSVTQNWHERYTHDPAEQWFRTILANTFRESPRDSQNTRQAWRGRKGSTAGETVRAT